MDTSLSVVSGVLAAMLFSLAQAEVSNAGGRGTTVAPPSCRQAVAQSRMVCVSGAVCQKELSPIFQACSESSAPSCVAARQDMRTHCGDVLPWYGSRECEAALRQVSHYCGR